MLETDAAQKVMRDAFCFLVRDLVGDDWQSLIELHCISVYDFSIEFAGYLNSQLPAVISTLDTG